MKSHLFLPVSNHDLQEFVSKQKQWVLGFAPIIPLSICKQVFGHSLLHGRYVQLTAILAVCVSSRCTAKNYLGDQVNRKLNIDRLSA